MMPQFHQAAAAVTRTDITYILKEACIDYFTHLKYGCFVEIGLMRWGKLRADVFAISLSGRFVICEIKSSWADYKADNKWTSYLKCPINAFYFVLPENVYKNHRAEFAAQAKTHGVGVLVLCEKTGYLKVLKKARHFDASVNLKMEMLLRLAWRAATYSKRNRLRRTRRFLTEKRPDYVSSSKKRKVYGNRRRKSTRSYRRKYRKG